MTDWRLSDDDFLAAFSIPADEGCGLLAVRHPFPREGRIVFRADSHTYLVDGSVVMPRSVTGFLHSFATPFDARRVLAPKIEAGELSEEEAGRIREGWEHNGEVQRSRGQLLHYHCELLANGSPVPAPYSPEFEQARLIYEKLLSMGLRPYRTELSVFHVGLRLAGQIDLLMSDSSSSAFVIVDWKRVRELRFDSIFNRLQYPLLHLADCNWNQYALQLNLYRFILESEYALSVTGMYLGVVHPDSPAPRLVSVPFMESEMLALRHFEIERGRASDTRTPFL